MTAGCNTLHGHTCIGQRHAYDVSLTGSVEWPYPADANSR
jgi:hypothetical protein